jgi:hypothetical protein
MSPDSKPFINQRILCLEVPCVKESGSSLSNLLFLCPFIACKHNEGCREVYERIVNKGKSKKLALIAVSNKLVKQSFAIAKSDLTYDETYVSILSK